MTAGVVDLFAGIGCVSRGFAAGSGFEPVLLVDNDPVARDNYLANHPEGAYVLADIAALDAAKVRRLCGGGSLAGVLGCPPCQGFSAAGRRDEDDVRNRLLGSFLALIEDLRPAFFVMENVPAILYKAELRRLLARHAVGYRLALGALNAACFGLPQTRERALVIGYRGDLERQPTMPVPTHFGSRRVFDYRAQRLVRPTASRARAILGEAPHIGVREAARYDVVKHLPAEPQGLRDLVTVGEAIRDLPPLGEGRVRPGSPSPYARALGAGACPLVNHEPWGHSAELVGRLRGVREGGLPARTAGRYYSQAYSRLHRRGLARTITTSFHNAGCGRYTHYAEPRTLSVREAARLQGIPDWFELHGTGAQRERLVGNAFPELWARVIAGHVERELEGAPLGG
jgi:DNA (cytosine-5)-methyltransferase 1